MWHSAVHWIGVTSLEPGVAFGAGYEEGPGSMDGVQPGEVQITPIQQVERTGLDHQVVQNIDLVYLAVGNVNEAEDGAVQVQQRMQFDRGLGRSKRCPGIQRQAQIDGGGVEGINGNVQVDAQRLRGAKRSGHANQVQCEVGVDLPRALGLRPQVDFDVAQ